MTKGEENKKQVPSTPTLHISASLRPLCDCLPTGLGQRDRVRRRRGRGRTRMGSAPLDLRLELAPLLTNVIVLELHRERELDECVRTRREASCRRAG